MTVVPTLADETRRAAQKHIGTIRFETPFHPRIAALMQTNDWYDWAGYKSANTLWAEELEYFAIRAQSALFDISPMVKYRIEGPDAEAFCNRMTLRDVSKLKPGRVQYTAWCDDSGHVLDDGTLFRLADTRFRLCCQERHLPWLLDGALGFNVAVTEETEEIAGLALQGPTSCALLKAAGFGGIETMKPFDIRNFIHESGGVTVSRTGFTGDLGYELFIDTPGALSLWDRLWAAGELYGIRAIGNAALNHARIEAGLIVANIDFITADHALRADRVRMPDETGLGWMVDLKKGHFNGRRAIEDARGNNSMRHVLVGLEIEGNVPADHAIVYHRKKREAGVITSAAWSPTAKRNLAIASLERPYGNTITEDLWVEIYALHELRYTKLMKRAAIVPRPFVKLPRRTATPPADC